MSSFIRQASTRTIAAVSAGLVALLVAGAVVAVGANGGGQKPPSRPLAQAVASSLDGPAIEGVSARVKFTNSMLGAVGTPEGGDPLVGGGTGRLWASKDGDVRIELQSEGSGGDLQLVARGEDLWLYHPASNTVYQARMPAEDKAKDGGEKWPPGVAAVERAIRGLTGEATVSGAIPDNIAGRPAYSTRIQPRKKGGLVGGADVSWDAANGAPLRLGIFPRGTTEPVLSLEATSVEFGPVDSAVFDVAPPAGARTVDLSVDGGGRKASWPRPVKGLEAARGAVGFPLAAPAELAGQRRTGAMAFGRPGSRSAVVRYGEGLGSITVIQAPVKPGSEATSGRRGGRDGLTVPTAKIGSVTGTAIGTPLGSVVSFSRDGVSYTVFGSVTAADALAAARGL